MSVNMNYIGSSQYSAYDKLLSLQSKYFEGGAADSKIGLYGYLTEGMSLVHEDGMLHRTMMSDEMFLNTASMQSSINNFAIQKKWEIPGATPSYQNATVAIAYNDVEKYSMLHNNQFKFDRKDTFDIGGFKFSLPYSVIIKMNGTNQVTAQYDVTEVSPTRDIQLKYSNNPYIKIVTRVIDGTKFMYLLVDLYQFQITTQEWENVSVKEVVDKSIFYRGTYDNQLVSFNVFYQPATKGGYELIEKYNDNSIQSENKYCYYNHVDKGVVDVFFGSLAEFKPEFGSTVKAEYFTSSGSSGNFEYNGEVFYQFSDEERKKTYIFTSLNSSVSSAGSNAPTLLETKQHLLHLTITNESIATDYDLRSFFETISKDTFSGESSALFYKKRDDVIKRIFGAYLQIVDEDGAVVPTNTFDLNIPFNILEQNNYLMKYGTLIYYDKVLNTYRILQDGELVDDMFNKHGNHLYTLPFTIKLDLDPFPKATYLDMFINDDHQIIYQPVTTSVNREFIMNAFNIKRNVLVDDGYHLSVDMLIGGEDNYNPATDIVVRAYFLQNGIRVAYKDLDYNSAGANYKTFIDTQDVFNRENKLRLDNVENIIDGGNYLYVKENTDVELVAYFRTQDVLIPVSPDYSHDMISGDYEVVGKYRPSESVNFFRSLDMFVKSDILINGETGEITAKEAPMVGAAYFFNTVKADYLKKQLTKYFKTINDNLNRIQNNSEIDIKFVNTFGISHNYSSPFVDISIELDLRLMTTYTAEIDTRIRQNIINFIKQTNGSPDRRMNLSNLTTYLEGIMSEIRYVNIKFINGMTPVDIEYVSDLDEGDIFQQTINHTPEFLNIGTSQTTVARQVDTPNIKINYI